MTTQLDRLEALAEKVWVVDIGRHRDDIRFVKDALPDLVRVARAARAVRVDYAPQMGLVLVGLEDLQTALAPLFAEAES